MKRIRRLILPTLTMAAMAAPAARPVARWDVIPDQRIDGVFQAGVCAFHEEGVQVQFSLNGKAVGVARKPTFNTRTEVWEFVFPVDTSKLPDGPLTLGAKAAVPDHPEEAYDLPELRLYANGKGSLTVREVVWADSENGDDANPGTEASPLKTLGAAVRKTPVGGTVRLKAGLYSCQGLGGGNRPYWTTIEAAPGVPRDAVEIGPGRPSTDRLRFRGVTFFCDATDGYTPILSGDNGKTRVWLDDCKTWNKKGRWAANANVFGNRYIPYITGGITTEMTNGPDGRIIRGHLVQKIASDVWTGSEKLVVNCRCEDVDPGSTGAHPDFHQSHAKAPGWVENVILYNVSGFDCKCQGLFGTRLRNSAFVNVLFERTPGNYFLSQYSGPMENVLFAHITLVGQNWLWRDGYTPKDVRVINCIFPSMGGKSEEYGGELRVHHCAFPSEKGAYGDDRAIAAPQYADPAAHDYHPDPASAVCTVGMPLQCVPTDLLGKPFGDGPRAVGALAPVPR